MREIEKQLESVEKQLELARSAMLPRAHPHLELLRSIRRRDEKRDALLRSIRRRESESASSVWLPRPESASDVDAGTELCANLHYS